MHTQCRNKSSNIIITLEGREQTLTDWAAEKGLPMHTVYSRINREGWSVEKALTTPSREKASPKHTPQIQLCSYLAELGMTKSDLAGLIGVRANNLYRAINGAIPMFPKYKRLIVKHLGVSEDIFTH